jgi:hypothetical protein
VSTLESRLNALERTTGVGRHCPHGYRTLWPDGTENMPEVCSECGRVRPTFQVVYEEAPVKNPQAAR